MKWLEQIKFNSHITLYGAGQTASIIYDLLKDNRSDIIVDDIFDGFRSGNFKSLTIKNIANNEFSRLSTYIIICTQDSATANEIKESLSFSTKSNTIILWPFSNENNLNVDLIDLASVQNIVKKLEFGSNIYQMVIDARVSGNLEEIKNYFNRSKLNPKYEQYFNHLSIEENDWVIDGGTFTGYEAKKFSELASKGRVFSFDPWGASKLNFDENIYKNLSIIGDGLWSKKTQLYFKINNSSEETAAASFVSEEADAISEVISVTSIDEFIHENKIEKLNTIQMDIEGSEIEAIRGARHAISKFKPKLALCIYHHPQHLTQIYSEVININPHYKVGFDHYSDNIEESVMFFY